MVIPVFFAVFFGFKSGDGTTVSTPRNDIENINNEKQRAYINTQKTILILLTALIILKVAKLIIYVIKAWKQSIKKEIKLRATQNVPAAAPQQKNVPCVQ